METNPSSSHRQLKQLLEDFLKQDKRRTLLLKGNWGAGKTHACKAALEAVRGHKRFSYCTAYGLSRTEEIYTRIAVGLIRFDQKSPPWGKRLLRFLRGLLSGAREDTSKAIGISSALLSAAASSLSGYFAHNICVVIDDLERATVDLKEILGVISELAEERDCHVIAIVAEDRLEGPIAGDFKIRKEKTFDSEFEFAPSVEENLRIMFAESSYLDIAAPIFKAFKTRNLRTMRLTSANLEFFGGLLSDAPSVLRNSALRNVAILTILHREYGHECNLTELRSASYLMMLPHLEKTAELSSAEELLVQANYEPDDFDEIIAVYLQTGRLDKLQFVESIRARLPAIARQEVDQGLSRIYQSIREDSRLKAAEIVELLRQHCDANAELLSPGNLMMAGNTISTFGGPDNSLQWLRRWAAKTLPHLTKEELRYVSSGLSDGYRGFKLPEEIQEKFDTYLTSAACGATLEETVKAFISEDRYNPHVISQLNTFSAENFYEWFSNSENPPSPYEIEELVTQCQHDPEGSSKEAAANIRGALQKFAAQDLAHAVRLKRILALFENR